MYLSLSKMIYDIFWDQATFMNKFYFRFCGDTNYISYVKPNIMDSYFGKRPHSWINSNFCDYINDLNIFPNMIPAKLE